MKSARTRSFRDSLEDVSRDIVHACRRAAREIAGMPWPAVLVCCIGLAFVLSILPLALFLFLVFMAVKVIVSAFVIERRRTWREQK